MKIAVTGGNGTLGRALVAALVAAGHQVVSVDRALPAQPAAGGAAQYRAADLRDFGQTVACLQGCQALAHLAAHTGPGSDPDHVVYNENTAMSYNALYAASVLGITRVCLASSVNAIGLAYSRQPRFAAFPLDESHPAAPEDPYSLSKWVLEQQAAAFARRHRQLRVASLRFHWLLERREEAVAWTAREPAVAARHLWGYTGLAAAARACLLALSADFAGHEALFIVAPRSASATPSPDLARAYYPDTPISGELGGTAGFFSCTRAARLLGWHHED